MRIAIRAVLMCLLFVSMPAEAERVSWYGIGDGSRSHSANNKKFNPHSLGVAHRSLPFGTKVLSIYQGKSVCATVIDRGPFPYIKISRRLGAGGEVVNEMSRTTRNVSS